MSVPYVRSWAGDGSILLYFGTAAPAPPPGRNQDHRTAGPEPRGSPPQWRHAGGALRSPAWGSLEKQIRFTHIRTGVQERHSKYNQLLYYKSNSSFRVTYIPDICIDFIPAQKMLLRFTLTRPTTPLRKSGQARTFPLWVTWEAGQLLARTLICSIQAQKTHSNSH